MPASDLALTHTFDGGFATDYGGFADIDIDAGRRVRVPFLTRAENIFYGSAGQISKIGGISKYNASTIESGEEIRGLFEYVRIGTGGSPTRKKVVVAGTKILADSNNGTFASIIASRQNDTTPHFCVFNDTLIMASDNTSDVPKKWDQTTAADLGGSPPRFSFSVGHANRLWAAGNWSVPSRLYYSDVLDAEDFAGGGSIDIDPDDGDYITGMYVFRGTLIVFKGPNFGSIHVISGLTPSEFTRTVLSRGVGAAWQNLIFPLPNDLGFVANDGTVRSIGATQKFGDLEVGSLSAPINEWLRENVSMTHLKKGWAATDFTRGYSLITLPTGSNTSPTTVLMMDFRFEQARFSLWTATRAWSVARMSDPGNSDRLGLFLGGTDGYVRKTQQSSRGVDGTTAISAYARTPVFQYSSANRGKTISHVGMSLLLEGSATMSLSLRRELGDTQTVTIEAGGGAALGSFVLGTDVLSGDSLVTKWSDVLGSGQFREISYEISNTALAETFTVEALHVVLEQSANPIYE